MESTLARMRSRSTRYATKCNKRKPSWWLAISHSHRSLKKARVNRQHRRRKVQQLREAVVALRDPTSSISVHTKSTIRPRVLSSVSSRATQREIVSSRTRISESCWRLRPSTLQQGDWVFNLRSQPSGSNIQPIHSLLLSIYLFSKTNTQILPREL